ncbi:uncharacterized protein LOC132751772 [Ruditapes philippinarum]|uniref:uncharacterized protein LOC132751772 n=1 Tax=Ruditapes philippinarum TaxID=129788 RepID=UPI00295A6CDC|nr:uncharacterized protein LOC132751772 [Ruditapes philippinarum]
MATCGNILSSEKAYDYNCTPCSQQERFVEAKRFCIECVEYFCSTCLAHHEKFGLTRGHTLVKCEEVSKINVPTPLSKCELHTDKEEDMVCGDHDVVCCRVCITKKHRSCQNIDYLPELARQFKDNGRRKELEDDLNDRIEELKSALKGSTARALKLKTRQTTHLKRLDIFQKSIVEYVAFLVNKTKNDIQNQFGPEICSIQEHLQKYNEQLSKLNNLSEVLSNENDEIFEYKKVLKCKHTLKEIQIGGNELDDSLASYNKFENEVMEAVVSSLNDGCLFGTVPILGSKQPIDVTSICFKEDKTSFLILLADFYNSKIRRFENGLNETESFNAKENIWGVCEVNKHEIAFTLPALKKVQFLSAENSQVLEKKFHTNIHCRGIACLNEKIYVTGGGMIGEEQGQLNVFDMKGKLLSKYEQDLDGYFFSTPRSIKVNAEGIFITDEQKGVVCLDLEGQRKWVSNNSKCKFSWGICFTSKGNLFVSGQLSNNIVIVSKDGEFLGELLNENDGLSAPKALSIDKRNNCILVSELKKPNLKMFYIGDCDI